MVFGQTDAVIDHRQRDARWFAPNPHTRTARTGVLENIGQRFLNGTIDRIGDDVVEGSRPDLAFGLERRARRPQLRILHEAVDTPLQAQFLDMHRPQPVQDPPIGPLQRFNRLGQLDRGRAVTFGLAALVQQRRAVGTNGKQQRAEFIVQFARKIAPFLLFESDQAPQQPRIVGGELRQGHREFVQLLAALPDFGGTRTWHQDIVCPGPQSRQARLDAAQRFQRRAHGQICDEGTDDCQDAGRGENPDEGQPAFGNIRRHAGPENQIAEALALQIDWKPVRDPGRAQQLDEP